MGINHVDVCYRMFIRGVKKTLAMSDIWDIMNEHSARVNYGRFSKEWQKELNTVATETKKDT